MSDRNVMVGKALDLMEHKRKYGNKKSQYALLARMYAMDMCGSEWLKMGEREQIMSKWKLIRETELVEVYEKNNGDMFVSFNKKYGYAHFCDGLEERYQLGGEECLCLEDFEWLTAKAKELFKGE